ncbi:MAG TPA: hypothetical protein VHB98_23115 [Chloroflexota bacterium]|nr:hypothetical protein [Chloroflexota bacterium]
MMVSFAQDIRPLFRRKDVQSMAKAFDLSNYDQVRVNAERIYTVVSAGSMPCDGAWSPDQVALFKQWMDAGYPA